MPDSAAGPAERVPGAGSQQALREANTRRVLQALADTGPMTQAALSRATGLSAATISNIVGSLRGEGVLTTRPTTSSGRRATLVELGAARHKVAAGIDIGRRHLRVILSTVRRTVLAEEATELPLGHTAEDSIAAADRLLTRLLSEAGLARQDVVGAGVGIPGPIEARTGRIAHGVILPAWVGFRPDERLRAALGLPVYIDNDANLGALAEVTWGEHVDAPHLIYIKMGTGIGAGLVLSGQVYRGEMGITGELGHIPVLDRGEVCRCGNRGCLETVASTSVMIEALERSDALSLQRGAQPAGEVGRLIEAVAADDPAAGRIVEDAGAALGQVLGGAVNLLNPSVVVIGGPLVPLGEAILGPVRRGLRRYASPTVGQATRVVVSTLGDRAEALGACSLVFQHAGAEAWLSDLPRA